MRRIAVVFLAVVVACSKKGPTPAKEKEGMHPPAPAKSDATSALWALAPADATFGVVVGDGFVPVWIGAMGRLAAVVEENPLGKKGVDAIREQAKEQGLDPFDPKSYAKV